MVGFKKGRSRMVSHNIRNLEFMIYCFSIQYSIYIAPFPHTWSKALFWITLSRCDTHHSIFNFIYVYSSVFIRIGLPSDGVSNSWNSFGYEATDCNQKGKNIMHSNDILNSGVINFYSGRLYYTVPTMSIGSPPPILAF